MDFQNVIPPRSIIGSPLRNDAANDSASAEGACGCGQAVAAEELALTDWQVDPDERARRLIADLGSDGAQAEAEQAVLRARYFELADLNEYWSAVAHYVRKYRKPSLLSRLRR